MNRLIRHLSTVIPFCAASVASAQQQAPKSLAIILQPLDNPNHLKGIGGGRPEDLSLLLRENGLSEPETNAQGVSKLTLQPRVCQLPHGVYAYSVLGFLEVPGTQGALRIFTAVAVRDPVQVDPGLRQAAADAAAEIISRIKRLPAGAPINRLLVPGAPSREDRTELVDLSRLKARVVPLPPALSPYARARNIAGDTRTRLLVNADGVVTRADFIQGKPELSLLALSDAMERSFVPLDRQGFPAPLRTDVQLAFRPDAGLPDLGMPPSSAPKEIAVYSHSSMH
ncbi:MAG TPA: hypothetical protein VFF76_00060 [Holophagaceae bacterium]|nr:hypothetical protein [Holophagaceae bacterium]